MSNKEWIPPAPDYHVQKIHDLRSQLEESKTAIRELVEGLKEIRDIKAPVFNGEVVTTLNPHLGGL